MGRISTNIGLISGFPITDTVDQLMALQAVPRDNLEAKNVRLGQQQSAITQLSAALVSLQISTTNLSLPTLYDQTTVSSSSPSISVSQVGSPPIGSYEFTPLRKVQSQQFLGSKQASDSEGLGGGEFTFRFGGEVDEGLTLDALNNGDGFIRGTITITDRSGASADVDLSLARTVDDVIDAVNGAEDINVTLDTLGDRFRLTDNTGQSGNLKVEEISSGTTAASLGLDGIDIAADSATGNDVVELFGELGLTALNNGLGVGFDDILADLDVNFRDGTSLEVDFRKLETKGTKASGTTNAANGVNAQVTITAKTAGEEFDGIAITYQDDPTVAVGEEVAIYNEDVGVLIVKINLGKTTAAHVVDAINEEASVNETFTASLAGGSSGASAVAQLDSTVLRGPKSTAIMPGTLDSNAGVVFTATRGGEDLDDVDIMFMHNGGLSAGEEYVVYDDVTKKLTFVMNESESTANHLIDALAADEDASADFTAELASGSDGTGLFDVVNDAVTTSGGAYIEPIPGGSEARLQDVIDTLNAADPARLLAEISADGERIVLTDLTVDNGGTFSVASLNDSRAAEDLGLTMTAAGDSLSGGRIFSGLRTVLLSSLNGGDGFDLGELDLTDRSGASTTVDLSGAVTLEDVIESINTAGIGISAQVNNARNGIILSDTTGVTTNNLVVADGGDGLETATQLGVAVDDAVDSIDGGSLRMQTVSENTLLSSLNGGDGVGNGTFVVTDTLGATQTININSSVETIGDVLLEFERSGLQVDARINDTGDGIVIVDTAAGSTTLTIEEGSGTTGRDLHILGTAETVDIEGTPTQVIDGSTTFTISLEAEDSLKDLRDKINELGAGVSASIFNDGSSIKPFRLNLSSNNPGSAGEMLLDTGSLGFTFEETVKAQDALLQFGSALGGGIGGILVSSSTNVFNDVVSGVTVTIDEATAEPAIVSVGTTRTNLTGNMIAIVDTFNRVRSMITDLSAYDAESDQRGLLQGDSSVLRLEADLSNLLTGRLFGAGSIRTLSEIGITIDAEGQLTFEQSEFEAKYSESPEAVKDFFTASHTGLADRFDSILEQLAGAENSVLTNRSIALGETVASNLLRIERINLRLESSRQLLLQSFYKSELAISKSQANLGALNALNPVAPYSG